MFYSHQLLARKAPLGQIWRAATLHAKINRRNLNKLNIINICEEILNPSVPMALRLSGILMGGVVIVYERKVKLLYEDVTRLLVEINEAWKVKAIRDPTILPKGKSQAKYDDVTLPDNQPADLGEYEQLLQFSNSATLMGINRSAFTEMNLDHIDDSYISHNQGGVDLPHNHHQADNENITITDRFVSLQADAGHFNQFERFDIEGDDIEGDEDTQHKFPSDNQTDLPNTLVPSPPPQDVPQNPDEIHEQHPGDYINHQSDEDKAHHSPRIKRPCRRRAKRPRTPFMDHEQTIIPGQMYQSWLQETSDIVSRRGRKRKHLGSMASVKIARLMDLPPVSLVCGLLNENTDIYYPLPLLQQWMKITQPGHDSPSGEIPPLHPPAPSSSSSPPPEINNYHDPTTFPFEDHHSTVGSGSLKVSVEKARPNQVTPIVIEELKTNFMNNGASVPDADLIFTPFNSGDEVRSKASSDSETGSVVVHGLNVNSGRPNKKRLLSSSRQSGSSLEPVAEEHSQDDHELNVELAKLCENDLEPDNDLIVETGPTQTQKVPVPDQTMEQLTNSIRIQLKTYFDTPGSAQIESLNQLAFGLDRKKAACLFYQICVLASCDSIKVEQKEPYGNILISRGVKM